MSRASAGQKQPLSLKAESRTWVSGQAGGRSPASRSPRQALLGLRPECAGRGDSRLPGAGARRWGVARRKAGRSTGEGLRSVPVGRVRGAPAPTPSESAPQTPVLAGKTSEPLLPPSRRLCLFLSCPARPRLHGCEVQGPRSAEERNGKDAFDPGVRRPRGCPESLQVRKRLDSECAPRSAGRTWRRPLPQQGRSPGRATGPFRAALVAGAGRGGAEPCPREAVGPTPDLPLGAEPGRGQRKAARASRKESEA